jgi:hypothetical protein
MTPAHGGALFEGCFNPQLPFQIARAERRGSGKGPSCG